VKAKFVGRKSKVLMSKPEPLVRLRVHKQDPDKRSLFHIIGSNDGEYATFNPVDFDGFKPLEIERFTGFSKF
jgi:hypothetical protein